MKLWSIEGNTQRLDGGSMFGNAPRALWSKWMQPDEANRIPLATRALLATPLNGRTVLFETGIGAFFEPDMRERFGVTESHHVLLDSLREAGFEATADFAQSRDADVLILCVPTPLTRHREPDLSFVISTVENLLPHLRPGQLLSLESTTYPGTTAEEICPRVERAGLRVGDDFFVVYSPEREDPGNASYGTANIPKIVGEIIDAYSRWDVASGGDFNFRIDGFRYPNFRQFSGQIELTF